jgi:spore maturation protein CgeB
MAAAPHRRRILYVGDLGFGGTSGYRRAALERIGQEVAVFDPATVLSHSRLLTKLRFRYPVGPLVARANRALLQRVREYRPDVVWFDKPLVFTPESLQAIKAAGALTVCYNQDNPFGPRNDGCWMQFYRAHRFFDMHCLFRTVDIPRYTEWRLPFIKIQLSYDPAAHFPPPAGWSDSNRTRGVSFIGTPYDQRPQFLRTLAEKYGLPIAISGWQWEKHYPPEIMAKYVVSSALKDAKYREGIWQSKINLTFVTESNEEDVGHKAFEITACAAFLLAIRTPGHLAAFEEDKEAVFFSSVEECAEKARYYLNHPAEREAIAQRGRQRAASSGYDNDTQLKRVLLKLDGVEEPPLTF